MTKPRTRLERDLSHGTSAAYKAGCRCTDCGTAELRHQKHYLWRCQQMGGHTTVDATRAAAVITELHQRMSYSAIGRAINSSHSYVTKIARGEVKRISHERQAAILGLRGYRPTDTSHVTPLGAQRRLQALRAIGYSCQRLSDETGYNVSAVKELLNNPYPVIEARNDQAIRAAYERLSMQIPTSDNLQARSGITRSRNIAAANRWAPPLAWDDIDDPNEQPSVGRPVHEERHRDDIDEATVLRVLAGDFYLPTSRAEKVEITRRWLAAGKSNKELCRQTGWQHGRYAPASATGSDALAEAS